MKLANGFSVSITPFSRVSCGFGVHLDGNVYLTCVADRNGCSWRVSVVDEGCKSFVGKSSYSLNGLIQDCADQLAVDLNPAF